MKLCAVICTLLATSAVNLSMGAEVVKSSSQPSPFTDGGSAYNIICPLFTILDFGDGVLEFVNCYRNSCNDIPDPGYGIFNPEPEPCDCPDRSGCQNAYGSFGLYDHVKPLPSKVPSDGPLPRLNKSIVMTKSIPGYFIKDDEPVYVRIIELAYLDKDAPQKTRSFILGLEMKSPLTGIEGLTEFKDVKPTTLPFAYTIQRPSYTVLIIRAAGITGGKDQQPKVATSASEKN